MIDKKQIEKLVGEFLEGTDCFLVQAKVSRDNIIHVIIDGDNGVTIDNCVDVSRHIEKNIDREEEDYELKVLSSGLDYPFAMLRQYKKYIGKDVSVTMQNDSKIQGVLLEAEESYILLQEEIEKKNKKKITFTPGEAIRIPMDEIKQTKAVIKFN
ncbi:MAG: ribosome assembly cofactor RimP [Bacteroidales bacterium]|nr:ribosome assembly cofactor RimP [Bacteroidales bacterium]